MAVDIKPEDLAEKPKLVGHLKGHKVYRIRTKGGFYVIAKHDGDRHSVIGSGPHQAIAAHVAEKQNPEIQWNELSKSEFINPDSTLVAKYTAITAQLQKAQKE